MAGRTDLEALVYEMDVNIAKLIKANEKAIANVNSSSTTIEGRYSRMSERANAAVGKTNLAKAFDSVFDASKLKALDGGAAQLGVFGAALAALGPVGIAAATGIVAFTGALKLAMDAGKFADELDDTASRLHVTTDALQEYRYATRAAGGEMGGADQALEAFSVALGKAQEGLKKGQRAFLALGFTKDQIMGFRDADSALQQVVARISQLKSDPQKDALIEQLGLTGMKPLILQGVNAMEQLKSEAKAVGFVMDADLVKRGAEVNKQFELAVKVVDVQLKSAFIDLAPVMLKLLQYAADFARVLGGAVDQLRSVENRTTAGLVNERNRALNEIGDMQNGRSAVPAPLRGLYIAKRAQQVDEINAQLAARARLAPPPSIPHGDRALIDQSPISGARAARATPDRSAAILDGLVQQQIAAAQALISNMLEWEKTYDPANLTEIDRLISEQADGERAAVEAARKKAQAEVDQQVASKALRGEAIAQARAAIEQTAADKLKLITTKEQAAVADAYLAEQKAALEQMTRLNEADAGIAQSMADLAVTLDERRKYEARALAAKQASDRAALQSERDAALAKNNSPENQAYYEDLLRKQGQQQTLDRQKQAVDNAGPVEAYMRSVQDLNTEFQNAAVSGAKALADGLADAIVNAKNLGEVASNVFKQILAQILSASLQKFAIAPFLAAVGIPAHAAGTDFAPGGLSLVGEKGPELVNMPRGAQVIPNGLTRGLLAAGSSRGSGGGVVINIAANDAVVASQLLETIERGVQRGMQYTNNAVATGYRITRAETSRAAGNRIW